MKVKDLKMLLEQLPEDLEILYDSYSEGILMSISGVSDTYNWYTGERIATINESNEDSGVEND